MNTKNMDYSILVNVYDYLEKTSERLKKVEKIAELFEQAKTELLPKIALLIQGRIFPSWSDKEIGIANLLMIKIIVASTGYPESYIVKKFKEKGDFGYLIEDLIKNKKQQTLFQKKLSIEKVFENLRLVAMIEGKGSQEKKFRLISELLSSAQPKEAKYIVRTILNDLRIGVADGVVRDAIVKAFFTDIVWDERKMINLIKDIQGRSFIVEKGILEALKSKGKIEKGELKLFEKRNRVYEKSLKHIKNINVWKPKSSDYIFLSDKDLGAKLKKEIVSTVERAWFLRPDYGEIAKIAKERGFSALKNINIELGKPIKVLLAEKAPSLEDALQSFENVAIEVKYDGARVQIHKKNDDIWLFTRRLEDITKQFPDIVRYAKDNIKAEECLIEGEIVGMDNGKPVPFQFLSQRIHRKYDIDKLVKEIPVQVNLFDIVYLNGKLLFNKPLFKRRRILESIIKPVKGKFQLANQLITKDLKTAEAFYKKAIDSGQEGVMVKNLDAYYQPGRRVAGGWLKVKPTLETLDLAIIGAQWGTGKRTGWLGSLILGCLDPDTGEFLECGMLGTGIKEKKIKPTDITFEEITGMLKPLILREEGGTVWVRPKIIIEVAYEEIQKSPNYSSGYALRFPRFVRLRSDKGPEEADDINRLIRIYEMQRGRK